MNKKIINKVVTAFKSLTVNEINLYDLGKDLDKESYNEILNLLSYTDRDFLNHIAPFINASILNNYAF